MPVRLIESLAATEPLAAVFSDASVIQAMLDFESALARAEARVSVIPEAAAQAITAAVTAEGFDAEELSRQSLRAGTPTLPLVKMLTARVRATDPSSAGFVHWGATSQDVSDTALVLLLRRCRVILAEDHQRLALALRRLSDDHAGTVMLARTLLQPAPPITFGLKAAGWLGAIHRSWTRLVGAFEDALVLQFGGASGTLAALGGQGIAVTDALADELKLPAPTAPWHTEQDRLASLMTALGVYTASLGKMALDISLLMQHEVAEVSEPGGEGRGGSSTMPHKRNPIACALTLAAARRMPGFVASFLACMLQEHERAAGGWQAGWSTVAAIVQTAGVALASMMEAAEGLTVYPDRMRRNFESTRGSIFTERAMMLLGPRLGRDRAHHLLEDAARKMEAEGSTLADVLAAIPEVTAILTPEQIRNIQSPEAYLGSTETFRLRLLAEEE